MFFFFFIYNQIFHVVKKSISIKVVTYILRQKFMKEKKKLTIKNKDRHQVNSSFEIDTTQ